MLTCWGQKMNAFDAAVTTEGVIRALTSNDRTRNKAMGPQLAKTIQAYATMADNERSQEFVKKAVKLTREGRQDEFLKEFMDLSENAAAKDIFKPVQFAVEKVIKDGKGDHEIRKLRKLVQQTGYGIFLFRHASLEALYGPEKLDAWKELVVGESRVEEALKCTADNPALYNVAMLFLHQQKVMYGEGEDSHAGSGLGSMSMEEYTRAVRDQLSTGTTNTSNAVDNEDWQSFEGIYGRPGYYARH